MATIFLKVNADITASTYEPPGQDLNRLFDEGRFYLDISKKDSTILGGSVGLSVSKEKIDKGVINIENHGADVRLVIAAVLKFAVKSHYLDVFLNTDIPFLFDGANWSAGDDNSIQRPELNRDTIKGLEYFERMEKRRGGDEKFRYYILPCEVSIKKIKL